MNAVLHDDKLEAVLREVRRIAKDVLTVADDVSVLKVEVRALRALPAIGPEQLTRIGETPNGEPLVTVTYPWPVPLDEHGDPDPTVLSIQPPDGDIETREADARGPYELAIQKPDRLVYAPLGPGGPSFVLPFVDVVPNA